LRKKRNWGSEEVFILASEIIRTAWGYGRITKNPPHTQIEAGENWEVWETSTGTFVGFAKTDTTTLTNVGGSQERILKWAKENAMVLVPPDEEPPEPPTKEPAYITVKSTPTGAYIYIDQKSTEKRTNARVQVNPGIRNVEVRLSGYKTDWSGVTATAGTTRTKSFTLVKEGVPAPPAPPAVPPEETPVNVLERGISAILGTAVLPVFLPLHSMLGVYSDIYAVVTGKDIEHAPITDVGRFVNQLLSLSLTNSLMKIFKGDSIYTGESKEVTFWDYLEIATSVLAVYGAVKAVKAVQAATATANAQGILTKAGVKLGNVDDVASITRGAPEAARAVMDSMDDVAKIGLYKQLRTAGPKGIKAADELFATTGPAIGTALLKGTSRGAIAAKAGLSGSFLSRLWLNIKANPIITIFAITEIPQLFLMSQFARNQIMEEYGGDYTNISIALGKLEKQFESHGYTLRDAVKEGRLEDAFNSLTTQKGIVEEYTKFANSKRAELEKAGVWDVIDVTMDSLNTIVTDNLKSISASIESETGVLKMGKFVLDLSPSTGFLRTPSEEFVVSSGDTISLPSGAPTIVYEAEGFQPKSKSLVSKEGVTETVGFILDKLPETITAGAGRLQILIYDDLTGAPISATLIIDGRIESFTLHAYVLDLKPSAYELRLEKAGYDFYTDTIAITEGEITALVVRMKKVPELVLPEEPELPPEIEPDVPEKGTLEVNANVTASIFIAGADTEKKTPTNLVLTPGVYSVTLKAEGYLNKSTTAYVNAGEVRRISLTLASVDEPTPKLLLAKVTCDSSPTGAKILINGEWTKKYTPDVVLLEAGEYLLEMTKSGYQRWSHALRLEEGI